MRRKSLVHDRVRAFTLLEMAVVMVISGLMMAAGMQFYWLYVKDKYLNEAYGKQDVLSASLSSYFSGQNRFPCPADPLLDILDVNAGVENCAVANALAMGACSGPGGVGGICKVPGRDTAADPDNNPDPVLIGAVPFKDIRQNMLNGGLKDVSLEDTLDPWGYQMTYAVSASMTVPATAKNQHGAISVQTEAGIALVAPQGSAHYVIISHGDNHAGAYNPHGQVPYPCVTGVVEEENCDGDALFVDGLRAVGAGPAYNDDVTRYQSFTISQLWAFNPDNPLQLYNLNPGGVGVGTNTPDEKLQVIGNMKAGDSRSNQICDEDGGNCLPPALLGGNAGLSCPPPSAGNFSVMRSIQNNSASCVELPLPTALANQSCPAGQFVIGFSSGGTILCGVI